MNTSVKPKVHTGDLTKAEWRELRMTGMVIRKDGQIIRKMTP